MRVSYKEIQVKVNYRGGVHARPSAEIVQCVNTFQADVLIEYNQQEKVADSLLEIMSLCIPEGAMVTFKASGERAGEVLEALKKLVEKNYC